MLAEEMYSVELALGSADAAADTFVFIDDGGSAAKATGGL